MLLSRYDRAMTERKPKKREAPISYRPPKKWRKEFYERLARSGLSPSAFITMAVLGVEATPRQRRISLEEKLIAKLMAQVARIQDALHELRLSKADVSSDLVMEEILEELRLIRVALFQALRRKP